MIKGVLKQFFTYGFGNILQTALSFILLPLYLRFFPPNEYGIISVLTVVMSLLTLFISGGVMNGLIRLYYEAEGVRRKELVGATCLWYLVVASLGGAILFSQAPLLSQALFRTEVYRNPIRILGFVFFFSMLRSVPLYILRLESKAGLYVGFSLFSFLADFLLKLYLIVSLGRGISGYFESSAIATMITLCLMIPFVSKYIRFYPNISFHKQLLRLGVPFIISGLSMWTLDVSDRLLLSRFSGESAVGIYSLAYTFANIFGVILATPVALLMDPFFFAFAAGRSTDDTKRLLQRTLIYFFIVGGIFYLAIALGSGELLRVLTTHFGAKEKYLEAANLVPILTLAPFLYFLATQAGLTALMVKKPEITSVVCLIAAALNLGLNLFIVPMYGAPGAALTTVIAYLVLDIIIYWRVGKIFPVHHDWKEMARGIFYLMIAFAIGWQIRLDQPVISLLVRVATGVMVFTLLTLFTSNILPKNERNKILTYLLDIKRKLATVWVFRF